MNGELGTAAGRSSSEESDDKTRVTVLVALAANLVIAVAKAVGGLLSGSPALLSEAAHSVADSLNEVFLLASLVLPPVAVVIANANAPTDPGGPDWFEPDPGTRAIEGGPPVDPYYQEFVKNAYVEADVDAIRTIRRLVEEGLLAPRLNG